jgi:quercetin dioxygenase-like cupin family protein
MRRLHVRFVGRMWMGVWLTVMGILAALLPVSGALAQQAVPGTSSRYLSRFQVAAAPDQFDLVQAGLDFGPGVSTPDYAYGGTSYNTVMDGAITLRENGNETAYKAGDTWSDPAGQIHALANNGQAKAIVYTSILLPNAANLTTTQQPGSTQGLPSGPGSLFLTRFPVSSAPSPLDLVQVELAQDPGSWTAVHTHPGTAYSTVIQGQLLVRSGGADTTYGPGQSWVNPVGQVHAVRDVASVPSVAFTTFLMPRGATQVTKPVAGAPATLPVTGRDAWLTGSTLGIGLAFVTILAGLALRLSYRRRQVR